MQPPLGLSAVLQGMGMRRIIADGFAAKTDQWLGPAGGSDYLAEMIVSYLQRQFDRAYAQGKSDGECALSGQLAFWSGQDVERFEN